MKDIDEIALKKMLRCPSFVRLGESDDATPTVRHVVREKEQHS